MAKEREVEIGALADLDDPGCREFSVGDGEWPFRGFVVRQGDAVFAYQNICVHQGHALNWKPDSFLTTNKDALICASHGAIYEISTGYCYAGPGNGRSLKALAVDVRDGVVRVTAPDSM